MGQRAVGGEKGGWEKGGAVLLGVQRRGNKMYLCTPPLDDKEFTYVRPGLSTSLI